MQIWLTHAFRGRSFVKRQQEMDEGTGYMKETSSDPRRGLETLSRLL